MYYSGRVFSSSAIMLSDSRDNEVTSSVVPVSISGHNQPITGCRLVGNSHIVTSSLDSTVRLWTRTGNELEKLECSSPVHTVVSVPDSSDNNCNQFLILACTDSGHLVVWRVNLDVIVGGDDVNVKPRRGTVRHLALHVPNPVTALAVSSDQRHLVTGCCYTAFGFVRANSTIASSTSSSSSSSCKLDRRTRGTVKTWNTTLLCSSQSDAELAVTCSRTAHQLTASMTSERASGYGVTCVAMSDDSSLLAVGLSSITPALSSSSSAAAAALVVVCNRDKLETLWVADDLSNSFVHDAVFHCQLRTWSLFIATNTTVEMLQLVENTSQQMTGLTLCLLHFYS